MKTYDRVVLVDRLLHLANANGRVDPEPVIGHRWKRPGRPLAHGREIECSCCRIELPWTLLHECSRCGLVPHRLRVRERGGLSLNCQGCQRRASKRRKILVGVSRSASRSYQTRLRASRRAMLVVAP